MFRTELGVHHQEHGIIYCIAQFGTIGTVVQASLAAFTQVYSQKFCSLKIMLGFILRTIKRVKAIFRARDATRILAFHLANCKEYPH